jgi:hypothetical protein
MRELLISAAVLGLMMSTAQAGGVDDMVKMRTAEGNTCQRFSADVAVCTLFEGNTGNTNWKALHVNMKGFDLKTEYKPGMQRLEVNSAVKEHCEKLAAEHPGLGLKGFKIDMANVLDKGGVAVANCPFVKE